MGAKVGTWYPKSNGSLSNPLFVFRFPILQFDKKRDIVIGCRKMSGEELSKVEEKVTAMDIQVRRCRVVRIIASLEP